ncbi:UBX domain-containing protein 10 [Clarias magur]|uniref:UBX domain-containing protein 10 n=1 Tax=Clarias magur TaxID=1594786 RepID=A0A8J4TQN0_CLAMG|nr:UBX domain-containing protein 10 [Clarias magur]
MAQRDMHVMRPKSAKGRTRPKVTEASPGDDALLGDKRPFSPRHPSHSPRPPPTPSPRFDSSPSPRPLFRHGDSAGSATGQTFDNPVLSLNKYSVLPSIEKRSGDEASRADMEKRSSRSRLHGRQSSRSPQFMERTSSRTVRCQEGETGVLLALRTPCGQRLECQFRPMDTLQNVVAKAGDISGQRYEHVLVETMEVPRRSFTDLNLTLSHA